MNRRNARSSPAQWKGLGAAIISLLMMCGAASCAATAPADGSSDLTQRHTLTTGGRQRSYLLHVPASYDGKPVPLLVALHPALATGERMEKLTHFDALADRDDFIVAYPDGINHQWNAGKCCGEPMEENIDDVGFVDAMVAEITSRYAVDPARHYVTGFSNGAFLVHYIACLEPADFAAYATMAGTITSPVCTPARPTPFLVIHGNKDTEVDWDGGEHWGYRRPSIPYVLRTLAERNHCSQQQVVTDAVPPATCHRYEGCGANDVAWCVIDGVGHQWPGSGETVWPWLLGPNTDQFNTSERIWDFFRRHPKQAGDQTSPSQ